METFGKLIRRLRLKRDLLLREVAAGLDIDPSLLSRIESDLKRLPRNRIDKLAEILDYDGDDLRIAFLSDRILYELEGEKLAMEAMSVAERKMGYHEDGQASRLRSTKIYEGEK